MNRKEEMEALIEDCERYAKIIEGIQVAPDNWKDGDPTRREPRETLLKCAAALRASAVSEEGINRTPLAFHDKTALDAAHEIEAMPSDLHKAQKTARIQLIVLKAIIAALPSDSGKAAPVTGHPVERLWRAAGLPEYFLGNGGSNTKLYELYGAIRNELYADLRALAPATEGGGREEIGGVLAEIAAERLGQISKGYDAAHDDEHTEGSIATAAAVYALHPFGWHFVISERVKGRSRSRLLSLRDFWPWEWDQFKPGSERQRLVKSAAMLVAEIERMDRLSPSPSVGTPAQTSAEREGGK